MIIDFQPIYNLIYDGWPWATGGNRGGQEPALPNYYNGFKAYRGPRAIPWCLIRTKVCPKNPPLTWNNLKRSNSGTTSVKIKFCLDKTPHFRDQASAIVRGPAYRQDIKSFFEKQYKHSLFFHVFSWSHGAYIYGYISLHPYLFYSVV